MQAFDCNFSKNIWNVHIAPTEAYENLDFLTKYWNIFQDTFGGLELNSQ